MSETHTFQAEISQLLHLLSHSLYQNKEIALRELISNASDALDKRRHAALMDESIRDDAELCITLHPDADAKTLTLSDNGIGMSRDDLVQNLGTIARSGSLEYIKQLAERQQEGGDDPGVSLIGQFGVGFYSSFMLASKVEVVTKSHDGPAHRWTSDGTGSYEIDDAERAERGTDVILHLNDDTAEFADPQRLKDVVAKYSTFVAHPILMAAEPKEDEEDAGPERLNEQRPIWVEPKSQVTDEQYESFYQHLSGFPDKPLWHLHLSFDSPLQVNAILYSPPTNLELLGFGKHEHGLSLCAKRVLVQDDCTKLLPEWLRFVYGLVDSDDLPLNVSREALQDSSVFAKIRKVLVGRVLGHLEKLGEEDGDEYLKWYKQFGPTLREGINDFQFRDRVAGLLRIPTSAQDDPTGLAGYVERIAEGQSQIYYAAGTDEAGLKANPHVAALTGRGLEVLLLSDPVDAFVLDMLGKFDDKRLVSVDSSDLELPESVKAAEEADEADPPAGFEAVKTLLTDALGDGVSEVKASSRLGEAPAALVNPAGAPSLAMQRIMSANEPGYEAPPRILELNPKNALVERLCTLAGNDDNSEFIQKAGRHLLHTAMLAEGLMPDVPELVRESHELLSELAASKSSLVL